MSSEERPELPVIVPVLNEERSVARFLPEFALQQEVGCELLVSDGGSADDSLAW